MTTLRLFAESAGYCQRPACNQPLFIDTDAKSIHIAELAHILAASGGGPRTSGGLTVAQRGTFENLIVLCPTCHTIVDKAPEEFEDELMTAWKSSHAKRIAALFGAVRYTTRARAHEAIEPALFENAEVFSRYGPDNDHRFDPESEHAATWKAKMLTTLLPNNRKILAIIDANRDHLSQEERVATERFRQHIEDLEAKHIAGSEISARRFPDGIRTILKD